MSYRSDDLTPLLAAQPPAGLGYRQGVVVAWNPATAENQVDVGGTLVDNLPILNTSEALLLQPGDVVGILAAGRSASSWAILGRLTIPGTPQAAATLGSGLKMATVIGSTEITTPDYALNGGPTVTTRILPTGRASISYSSGWDLDVGKGVDLTVTGTGPGGVVWWGSTSLTGANLLTVTTGSIGGAISHGGGTSELAEGLAPGQWTFSLYSRKRTTGNPFVYNRVLAVAPA